MSTLYERYPQLIECKDAIEAAKELWIHTFEKGGKLLACGNGGSCADCEHIVGELMKGFLKKRTPGSELAKKLIEAGFAEDAEFITSHLQEGLPAISLTSHSGLLSAYVNDVSAELMYAQQVNAYGEEKDVLICLSTSGNSANVVYAAKVAKAKGVKTIALTGQKESKLSKICDITIRVPETETYKIQELHLPVYHYLCAETEAYFYQE